LGERLPFGAEGGWTPLVAGQPLSVNCTIVDAINKKSIMMK